MTTGGQVLHEWCRWLQLFLPHGVHAQPAPTLPLFIPSGNVSAAARRPAAVQPLTHKIKRVKDLFRSSDSHEKRNIQTRSEQED